MSSNISHLLEDISARHACKNISKYVAEFEKSLGIKVNLGNCKYEYVYKAAFEFCSDARNKQKRIIEFGQSQKLFSVEKCDRSLGDLCAVFKFHPENAI